MVLTEQSETKCYGAATVEDATWATENQLYNIVDGRRIAKTVEPGASGIASFGAKFYRTNGNNSNERTGLGIVLKVMKGDQVKITAESFYSIPGGNAGVPINMAASELLNALLGANGFPVGKGLSSTNLAALNTPTSLQSFLNTNSGNSSLAKAAVNYALFDEQMRFVGGDYDPVPSGGGYKNHQKFFNSPVNITRSGYLYIYVSNESNLNVFFDNLNVSHTNGPILEETHYYPFGLTMAGISSKALTNIAENKRGFNGNELQSKEFFDQSGLDFYDFNARTYDQQIGRFIQVDPLFEDGQESINPYHFSYSNPIRFADPDGRSATDIRIRGENNSNVTIKTDLIDIDINAGSLGVDFGGNYTLEGDELLGAALDIVGFFDPSGIADGINAKLSFSKGDWLGAGISAFSVLPGGDITKLGKIGKDVKIIEKAVDAVKAEKRAAKLSETARAGKDFTKAGKEAVVDLNKAKNGGAVKCESCGTKTLPSTKSQKGVTPSKKERQVDHVKPKSKGGSGTPDNGQVLCRDCNIKKSNN
jgi:RHS repeat-associated protein